MGNRERYLIEGMPKIVHDEKIKVSEEELEKNKWIKNNLSKNSLEYIERLPRDFYFKVEGKTIYITHYPLDNNGNFKKHIKNANIEENNCMFKEVDADIYLYGHTHKKILNKSEDKLYINPGALGCPGNTNFAPYIILEINNNNIKCKELKCSYNKQKVIEEIKNEAFPGYKNVLKLFYNL